jgi:hypothetical protein
VCCVEHKAIRTIRVKEERKDKKRATCETCKVGQRSQPNKRNLKCGTELNAMPNIGQI